MVTFDVSSPGLKHFDGLLENKGLVHQLLSYKPGYNQAFLTIIEKF